MDFEFDRIPARAATVLVPCAGADLCVSALERFAAGVVALSADPFAGVVALSATVLLSYVAGFGFVLVDEPVVLAVVPVSLPADAAASFLAIVAGHLELVDLSADAVAFSASVLEPAVVVLVALAAELVGFAVATAGLVAPALELRAAALVVRVGVALVLLAAVLFAPAFAPVVVRVGRAAELAVGTAAELAVVLVVVLDLDCDLGLVRDLGATALRRFGKRSMS